MSYVVLARKWRPRVFEDLTGQDHVARTLRNAIEADRVPHALLFTGARGVGKTSTARILAMALNCQKNGTSPQPCGECDACEEIQSGRSVDVLEIDGASNRGINEIRELRDSVMFAPQRDPFKIYIIDEVHMLTQEAFNALLKTLEEPPPHVIFVFATTEPQKIPVTILSRCQRFDFRRISQRAITERLSYIAGEEGLEIDDEALALIARQAQGGMRDALSLLDQLISFSTGRIDTTTAAQLLGAADKGALFQLSDAMLRTDVGAALGVLDRVREFGTDPSWFAAELVNHLRDLAVMAAANPEDHAKLTSLTESEIERAREQLHRTNAHTLHRYFRLAMDEAEEIQRSSFADFRLELALINLCRVSEVDAIDDVIALLRSGGNGRESGRAPATRSDDQGNDDEDESDAGVRPSSSQRTPAQPQQSSSDTREKTSPSSAAQKSTRAKPSNSARQTKEPAVSKQTATQSRAEATEPEPSRTPAQTSADPDDSHLRVVEDGQPSAEQEKRQTEADGGSEHNEAVEQGASETSVTRTLDIDEWRTLSEHASDVTGGLSGLFQGAYLLPSDGKTTAIAVSAASHARFDEETRQKINELAQNLFGVNPELTLLNFDTVDPELIEQSDRIADIEAREEQARKRQVRNQLRNHETTNRIMELWPDSKLRIEVHEIQDEEPT
jgi:DNA polymerase-3 subunit gamma/tau